MKILYL